MTTRSPTFGGLKSISNNLFAEIHQQWRHLPGNQGLNSIDQATQTSSLTPLESVRKEAEVIANDIVKNFGSDKEKGPPNRFCKTMRKTVKEVSDRHDIALSSMVNRLHIDDDNMFETFINVANEIFDDGRINWGRIVVVYAFASRLTSHFRKKDSNQDEKIALYVGKYVGNKLGLWILDNGGWVRNIRLCQKFTKCLIETRVISEVVLHST